MARGINVVEGILSGRSHDGNSSPCEDCFLRQKLELFEF